jgi:hypothetical protein
MISVFFSAVFKGKVNINKKKERILCMRKICMVCILISMELITGCTQEEDSFMTTDITFCKDEPFQRSYEQNSDRTYCQGELVWVYLECFRFSVSEDNGEFNARFNTTLEIFDNTGTCVHRGSEPMKIPTTAHPVYIWLKFWVETDAFPAGTYTLSITVEDILTGDHSPSRGEFYIVSC